MSFLPLQAVFMGTPGFAARILEDLCASGLVTVRGVYTQPDRPAGRGKKVQAPAVKVSAERLGLPVFQPSHFKDNPEGDAAFAGLRDLHPDILVVAAYGLILPQRILDLPSRLPINVHASLLPRYRGAAPVQRAVINGDPFTGITIMRMVHRLDAGPVLLQRAVGIDINQTSGALMEELSREGAQLLMEALERLKKGTLREIPQDEAQSSYAAKLSKDESRLDLRLPVFDLHARIRGLTPWPGASLTLVRPGQPDLEVGVEPGIYPKSGPLQDGQTGRVPMEDCPVGSFALAANSGQDPESLLVRSGDGWYSFPRLKPAGKQPMAGRAFFNGYLKDAPQAYFSAPS